MPQLSPAPHRSPCSNVSWVYETPTAAVDAAALVATAGTGGGSQVLLNNVNQLTGPGGTAGQVAVVNNAAGGAMTVYNMGGTLQVDALRGRVLARERSRALRPTTAHRPVREQYQPLGQYRHHFERSLNAGFGEVALRASGGSITENSNSQNAGDTITAGSLAVVVDAAPTNNNVSLVKRTCLREMRKRAVRSPLRIIRPVGLSCW